jgi:hypothetical protein
MRSVSSLQSCRLDVSRAKSQLGEFKQWLADHAEFDEKEAMVELRSRLDLCLLIQVAVGRGAPDRFKFEMEIQGAFRADLVVGSATLAHFVMVEFEGGRKNSLFKRGKTRLPEWGQQIQRAFGQVSDWSWAKNDNQKSDLYRDAFGLTHMSETYLVVCGRSMFVDPVSYSRLHWRSTKTMIASCPIYVWTYDDLCAQAKATLDFWLYRQPGV